MMRGELWWAELPPPSGRRPVLLLSRDEAYAVRELLIASPITTRIRDLPTEVRLGLEDGLPRESAVNLDVLITIPKRTLQERIAVLSSEKVLAVDRAVKFALGLDD